MGNLAIMINNDFISSLNILVKYIGKENYYGYDPYDTLNSFIPFEYFGKWISVYATQFQKRNPINIRPLLGIKKFRSTKGLGLLLKAYVKLYLITNDENLLPNIEYIKNWLIDNKKYYNDAFCWGYDYPYATKNSLLPKGFPTVIHHSYIIDSLFEYYKAFKNIEVYELIKSSYKFVINNLQISHQNIGKCFSYNPKSNNICCYNASLHAAKVLAIVDSLNNNFDYKDLINEAIDFVISKQKENGVWFYSIDKISGKERRQIDFHQGFILESLFDIKNLTNVRNEALEKSIKRGLKFYKENQFLSNGQSLWRIPKAYPVDIHNQSQGIITFSKLHSYNKNNLDFAKKIIEWTINNMQSNKGFFYYRNFKNYKNKIPYMRWGQSWMLLAFAEYFSNNNNLDSNTRNSLRNLKFD